MFAEDLFVLQITREVSVNVVFIPARHPGLIRVGDRVVSDRTFIPGVQGEGICNVDAISPTVVHTSLKVKREVFGKPGDELEVCVDVSRIERCCFALFRLRYRIAPATLCEIPLTALRVDGMVWHAE